MAGLTPNASGSPFSAEFTADFGSEVRARSASLGDHGRVSDSLNGTLAVTLASLQAQLAQAVAIITSVSANMGHAS